MTPQPLLQAGSRAMHVKITTSGTPNSRNCCEISTVLVLFTNVAAGWTIDYSKFRQYMNNPVRSSDCCTVQDKRSDERLISVSGRM